MVVCRYFLQGCCKFGDHCRYQHYQERNANQVVNYRGHSRSWHSPTHVQPGRSNYSGTTYHSPQVGSGSINPLDLAEAIKEDVVAMEEGNQWPLSCYTPSKDFGSFPGFHDMSMEEVRYEAYQAQVSGTFDQYVKKIENLIQATRMKWGMLKNPTGQVMSVIEKMASGQGVVGESPSAGAPSFSFNSSAQQHQQQLSGFSLGGNMGFAAPQPAGSIFAPGNPTGVSSAATSSFRFALMPQSTSNSPFGTPASHANSSINFGGTPVFGQSGGLLFGNATTVSSPIAPGDVQQQQPMSTGFFGDQPGAEKQESVFGGAPVQATDSVLAASASGFGTNAFQAETVQPQYSNLGIYTPLSELTEAERKEFMAVTFTLGSVPMRSPPSELCV